MPFLHLWHWTQKEYLHLLPLKNFRKYWNWSHSSNPMLPVRHQSPKQDQSNEKDGNLQPDLVQEMYCCPSTVTWRTTYASKQDGLQRIFHALKASIALMSTRLAPLLLTFNTEHFWMIEWQTDQFATEQLISPSQLSTFFSIWEATVSAQQCLY